MGELYASLADFARRFIVPSSLVAPCTLERAVAQHRDELDARHVLRRQPGFRPSRAYVAYGARPSGDRGDGHGDADHLPAALELPAVDHHRRIQHVLNSVRVHIDAALGSDPRRSMRRRRAPENKITIALFESYESRERRSQRRVTRRRAASLEASSKLEFDDVRVYGDALARPRRGPGRRRRATERWTRRKRRRSREGATGPGLRARLRRTGRPGYRVPPRGQSRLRLQERADGAPGTVQRRQGTSEQGTSERRPIQCPRRAE